MNERRRQLLKLPMALGAVGLSQLLNIPSASAESMTLGDKLMAPFKDEALKRRAKRKLNDPDRVDWNLAEGKVVFGVMGRGESYEPRVGDVKKNVEEIGSQTIYIYDEKTKKFAQVNITHDIWAPEVSKALNHILPSKIDYAYIAGENSGIGGFNLQRQVLENATGLPIDFQAFLYDEIIAEYIRKHLGDSIEINSPLSFWANPVSILNKWYERRFFQEGPQEADGVGAVQFIKSVAEESGPPKKEIEHNKRKPEVVKGMRQKAKSYSWNPKFWTDTARFISDAASRKRIMFDFSWQDFIGSNFGGISNALITSVLDRVEVDIPGFSELDLYVCDIINGDGGVRWATGHPSPLIQKILKMEGADKNVEVPLGDNIDPYPADPNDLINTYWKSTREFIKSKILQYS